MVSSNEGGGVRAQTTWMTIGLAGALGCRPEVETDTAPPVEQSQVCADYVACAAVADPESVEALSASYGAGGSCWAQDQAFADTCSEACATGVDALAEIAPRAEGCAPYASILVSRSWTVNLREETTSDCGYVPAGGTVVWTGAVVWTGESKFRWNLVGTASLSLDCTASGTTFDCAAGVLLLHGEGRGDEASGDYRYYADECTAVGAFDATAD